MPLLRLESVHKSFPGVQALKPLSLELGEGEALGLVGENGAGKSTLIKLLSGVHAPDGGTIEWQGRAVHFASPRDAIARGVACLQQELSYCGRLTVAENLLLGEPWPRRPWGAVDWRRLEVEAAARLSRFGLTIAPRAFLHSLRAAEKQEVAIARALAQEARLLILDEPTASLSEPEAERLFAHLRSLKAHGVAVIYVSHRLDEILRLTDRVAVLRDGGLVGVHSTRKMDARLLASEMAGREVTQGIPRERKAARGDALLEAIALGREGAFADVSLALHSGEVVGLAGLGGSGRQELARALYGLLPVTDGTMRMRGRPWRPSSAEESRRAGIAYLPEERKRQALVLDHSLGETMSIGFSDLIARFGWIRRKEEASRLESAVRGCSIKSRGLTQSVGTLSGGNQQKALLARWLLREPEILLLNEPTRGVDVGAKAEIHRLIEDLSRSGRAVLLVSSDVPELVRLCDRVIVLCGGRVSGELEGESLLHENVLLACSGLWRGAGDSAEGVAWRAR